MKAFKIKHFVAIFLLAVISSNQVKSYSQTGTGSLENNTTYHDDSDSFEKAGYTFLGNDTTGQIKNGKVYAIIYSENDFRSVFKLYRQKRSCEKTFASFDKSAERDRIICDKKIVKLLKKSIKDVIKMKPSASRTVEIFKHIKNNPDVLKVSEEWNGREEQALDYIDSYIITYNALQSYEKELLSEIKEKYDIENRSSYYDVCKCLKKYWNVYMSEGNRLSENEEFRNKYYELKRRVDRATSKWEKDLAQKEFNAFASNENKYWFHFNYFRTRLEEAFEGQIQKGVDSLTYTIQKDETYVVSADNEVKIFNVEGNYYPDYYFRLKDGRWAKKFSGFCYSYMHNKTCDAFVVFNKKLTRTMLPSLVYDKFQYYNYKDGCVTGDYQGKSGIVDGDTIPVDIYGEFVDKKYAFEITPTNLCKVLYINVDNENYHLYSAITCSVKEERANNWVYSEINKCSVDSLCSLGKMNASGEMPSYDINDYALVNGYDYTKGDNTRMMFGIPVTSPLVAKAFDYVAKNPSPAALRRAKQQAKEREAEEKEICIRMPYYNFKKYYKHTIVRRGTNFLVAKYKNTYYYFYYDSYFRYYYLDHWAMY